MTDLGSSGGMPLTEELITSLADGEEDAGNPAVDGMPVTVRLRHDFVITDAARLMGTARDLFRRRCPEVPEEEVPVHVAVAEDAVYELVNALGISGIDGTEKDLPKWVAAGVQPLGFAGLVRPNDPNPLLPTGSCFDHGDPFAVPDWDSM